MNQYSPNLGKRGAFNKFPDFETRPNADYDRVKRDLLLEVMGTATPTTTRSMALALQYLHWHGIKVDPPNDPHKIGVTTAGRQLSAHNRLQMLTKLLEKEHDFLNNPASQLEYRK